MIEKKQAHQILVLSTQLDDARAIRSLSLQLSDLLERVDPIWEPLFLPMSRGCDLDFETIQPRLAGADVPKAIFLFLSENLDGSRASLETVYTAVQSLMSSFPSHSIEFYLCLRGQDETPLYEEALAGLFKSAMLENFHHRYRVISSDDDFAANPEFALKVFQEWLGDGTSKLAPATVSMVRYRGSGRFELCLEENQKPSEMTTSASLPSFRKGATYLMVGALGETGKRICQEFGKRYQSELIIVSRRSEGEVAESLSDIRKSGASVRYLSVDILDLAALEQSIDSLRAKGVVINGVIHCARRVVDGPIVKKTFEEFQHVMAAKVEGTSNIDRVTLNEPLEFFFLFSSMAAFGIQGSPDYAFSTAYQNAFARHRNSLVAKGERKGTARSFCWGQWEIDGAVDPKVLPKRLGKVRQMGMDLIDGPSAMDVMNLSMDQGSEVVGYVAVSDRPKLREKMGLFPEEGSGEPNRVADAIDSFRAGFWTRNQFAEFLEGVPDEDLSESDQAAIIEAIMASERTDLVEEEVRPSFENGHVNGNGKNGLTISSTKEKSFRSGILVSVANVLKVSGDEVDWDQPLPSYGVDSIIAMQLATTLEKELGLKIEPRWLVEFPTLRHLEQKLVAEQKSGKVMR